MTLPTLMSNLDGMTSSSSTVCLGFPFAPPSVKQWQFQHMCKWMCKLFLVLKLEEAMLNGSISVSDYVSRYCVFSLTVFGGLWVSWCCQFLQLWGLKLLPDGVQQFVKSQLYWSLQVTRMDLLQVSNDGSTYDAQLNLCKHMSFVHYVNISII